MLERTVLPAPLEIDTGINASDWQKYLNVSLYVCDLGGCVGVSSFAQQQARHLSVSFLGRQV